MTYQPVPAEFQVSARRPALPAYPLRHLGSRTIEWAVINITTAIRALWRRHRERRWRTAWRNLSPHQLRDLGLQPATIVWLVDAPRTKSRRLLLLRVA